MAKGKNAERRFGRDFWSRRPFSTWPASAWAKVMCRRKERRVLSRKIIEDELGDMD